MGYCKEYNIHPLVTSPQFELWLLMHFDDVPYGKPSYHKSYGCVVEGILGDYDKWEERGKRKRIEDEERVSLYVDNIDRAIENSKMAIFEDDPLLLVDHPGTNLGKFFEEVLRGS